MSEAQRRAHELETSLATDFGPEDAFLPLHGQCFDLTDREYVYQLCPFDRAIQRPKDGGAETSLGRWGSWLESPADASGEAGVKKYHRMKYSGGATCWNGPARSVDVTLHCGLENRLSSASEPSRCEYSMHFITPALCVREESLMTPAAEADATADHATSHEEL